MAPQKQTTTTFRTNNHRFRLKHLMMQLNGKLPLIITLIAFAENNLIANRADRSKLLSPLQKITCVERIEPSSPPRSSSRVSFRFYFPSKEQTI